MRTTYIVDKSFTGKDSCSNELEDLSYENCTFSTCNFSQSDLSGISFQECVFEDCDFSMAKINATAFRDVSFQSCKLLGLHFDECNPFLLEMSFENCQLNLSSFYKLKLKKISYNNCTLHEVDFMESDLTSATFLNCDLKDAIFEGTNLEKADLRSSMNYSINPKTNRIKKARFSIPEVIGLLDIFDIKIG